MNFFYILIVHGSNRGTLKYKIFRMNVVYKVFEIFLVDLNALIFNPERLNFMPFNNVAQPSFLEQKENERVLYLKK